MPESSKSGSKAKEGSKSKKNKNSSKTARVLGLLTSSQLPSEDKPVTDSSSTAPAKPKPASDETVEAQIRDALEEELDLAPPAPSPVQEELPKAEPAPESVPVPEPEPVREPPPAPEPKPEPVREPPPAPEPKPEPVREPPPAPKAASDDALLLEQCIAAGEPGHRMICYNVMQALVKDKAEKYMRLFGICTCPRCRVDVMALALTNLPAKYIVVKEHEFVPLLSLYEGRYNAAVVSQVISACKTVMEHPRHKL